MSRTRIRQGQIHGLRPPAADPMPSATPNSVVSAYASPCPAPSVFSCRSGMRVWKDCGDAAAVTVPEARARAVTELTSLRGGTETLSMPFETAAEEVFRRYGRRGKPRTLEVNQIYCRRQILPWFGGRPTIAITAPGGTRWAPTGRHTGSPGTRLFGGRTASDCFRGGGDSGLPRPALRPETSVAHAAEGARYRTAFEDPPDLLLTGTVEAPLNPLGRRLLTFNGALLHGQVVPFDIRPSGAAPDDGNTAEQQVGFHPGRAEFHVNGGVALERLAPVGPDREVPAEHEARSLRRRAGEIRVDSGRLSNCVGLDSGVTPVGGEMLNRE